MDGMGTAWIDFQPHLPTGGVNCLAGCLRSRKHWSTWGCQVDDMRVMFPLLVVLLGSMLGTGLWHESCWKRYCCFWRYFFRELSVKTDMLFTSVGWKQWENMCCFCSDIFVRDFWGSRVSTMSKSENWQASLVESRQKEAGSSVWWSRF